MYSNPWKDEAKVALLKQLYAEGHSASHIAARIGGVSRNAVIGKAHRLGLVGTQPRVRRTRHAQRSRAERKAIASRNSGWKRHKMSNPRTKRIAELFEAEPFQPSEPEVFIPMDKRKRSIIELADIGECKWPIGDPREPDFHFCGRKQVSGLPYCETHCRRAFQPPQPTQRRSPSPAQTNASAKEEKVHA